MGLPLAMFASALIGAGSSAWAAKKESEGISEANEMNLANAREAREWQERMSNTEIQRRVKDMETAGINKLMAVSSGGASTPTPVTATVENSSKGLAQNMASTAQMVARIIPEIEQIKANQSQLAMHQSQMAVNEKIIEKLTGDVSENEIDTKLKELRFKTDEEMSEIRKKFEKIGLVAGTSAKFGAGLGGLAITAKVIKDLLSKGKNSSQLPKGGDTIDKVLPKVYKLKTGSKMLKYLGKGAGKLSSKLSLPLMILDMLQMPGDVSPRSVHKK